MKYFKYFLVGITTLSLSAGIVSVGYAFWTDQLGISGQMSFKGNMKINFMEIPQSEVNGILGIPEVVPGVGGDGASIGALPEGDVPPIVEEPSEEKPSEEKPEGDTPPIVGAPSEEEPEEDTPPIVEEPSKEESQEETPPVIEESSEEETQGETPPVTEESGGEGIVE